MSTHSTHNFYQTFRKEGVPFGWAHAKKHIGQWILVGLVYIGMSLVVDMITPPQNANNPVWSLLASLVNLLCTAWFTISITRILLDVIDGHTISLNHFLVKTKAQRNLIRRWIGGYITMTAWMMWPAIIAAIIVGIFTRTSGGLSTFMARFQSAGDIITTIAFIVISCVVIGIIFYITRIAISLSFRQYFMIDKNMGIKESLLASRDATRGHLGELFSAGFLGAGIFLLGGLCIFIGLIRAIPTVMLATAFLYRKIAPRA